MQPSSKDLTKLIRWYQDETGILEFQMDKMTEFAKRKGVEMPTPPTPEAIFARRLARAARRERRRHKGVGVECRGILSYPKLVNGQYEFVWFDADGPAATLENMKKAQNLRREQTLNDGVQIAASDRHWNMTHPGEEKLQTSLDLNDEVMWRLNGADQSDADELAG